MEFSDRALFIREINLDSLLIGLTNWLNSTIHSCGNFLRLPLLPPALPTTRLATSSSWSWNNHGRMELAWMDSAWMDSAFS